MAINKVVRKTASGTQTLIDLTADTVIPAQLARGYTAHNAKGEIIKGAIDIRGYIGANNEITLYGDLPKAPYTLVYQNADGTVVEGISLNLTPVVTNLFNKDDADVVLKGRFNSSNRVVSYANGQLVTGYIEAKVGDKFIITTDKTAKTNGYTGMAVLYDTNKAYIKMGSQIQISNSTTYWTFSDDGLTGEFTILDKFFNTDMSATTYVRFCVAYNNIDNIVITKS